jgi:hypothetical protein
MYSHDLNKNNEQLTNNENNNNIKNIFDLNWEDKPYALWLDNLPDNNINFSINIKLKNNQNDVIICGTLPQNNFIIPNESYYSNISYLKSHLQKCIRRGFADKAVKTAYHMIKLDIKDFLKFLIIIMIEDVVLHDSLSIILWLLSASTSKNFIFQKKIIEWLLNIVYTLCYIKEHDKISKLDKIKDINRYNQIKNNNNLSLLYSLQFILNYINDKEYVKIINYFSELWFHRFIENKECNKLYFDNNFDIFSIKKLSKKEWELSAIDLSCAPYLINWIKNKFNNFDEDEIKSILWHNNSKINFRDNIDLSHGTNEYWNKIKMDVVLLQTYILKNFV